MDHKTKTWKFWRNLQILSFENSNECINEWDRIRKDEIDDEEDITDIHINKNDKDSNKLNTCICGQRHLVKVYFFRNNLTDHIVPIGCKCIQQFYLKEYTKILKERDILKEQMKDLKRQLKTRCATCGSIKNKKCLSCADLTDDDIKKLNNNGYVNYIRKLNDKLIYSCHVKRQIKILNIIDTNKKEIEGLKEKLNQIEELIKKI